MRFSYSSFHFQMRVDQLLAAQVVAGLLFLFEQPPFDDRLRGDAGVVGAGHPHGVVALHPLRANENVLQRVVERVPHVQRPGDIRRRNDDAVRLRPLWIVGLGVRVACAYPKTQSTSPARRRSRDDWVAFRR